MRTIPHRTIRESASFAKKRDALVPDARAWEEMMDGFDITLAVDPTVGEQVGDGPYWLIVTPPSRAYGVPGVRVMYRTDAQFVDLVDCAAR